MIISVIRNPFEQIISYAYHKPGKKELALVKNEIKVINEIVLKSHKNFLMKIRNF